MYSSIAIARNAGTLLVKLTCTRGLDERLIRRRVHVLLLLCSQVGVAVLNMDGYVDLLAIAFIPNGRVPLATAVGLSESD